MRTFKAGVPLFAIILTLLALGTMANKGVVNKKGEETSKVVLAEQWYSLTFIGSDPELPENQKITGEASEPGPDCSTSNEGLVCGVIITFPGAVPPFSEMEEKTLSQILLDYPSATLNYTKLPE